MTLSLLDLAARHWDRFDGWCRDIDPWDLPARRMLSFIYTWATEGADPDEIAKFDRHLWMPPKGVATDEGPWAPAAERAAFQGLASELNIKTGPPQDDA